MSQASIPGTYIRYAEHEFGEEYDTLSISVLNLSAKQYKIVRRWKYERVGEAPSYQLIVSSAIWNDRFLEDMESGDLISFDSTKNCLFIGTIKYDKL